MQLGSASQAESWEAHVESTHASQGSPVCPPVPLPLVPPELVPPELVPPKLAPPLLLPPLELPPVDTPAPPEPSLFELSAAQPAPSAKATRVKEIQTNRVPVVRMMKNTKQGAYRGKNSQKRGTIEVRYPDVVVIRPDAELRSRPDDPPLALGARYEAPSTLSDARVPA